MKRISIPLVLLFFLSYGTARADFSLSDILAKVKSFPVPGGEVVRQLSPPGVQPRVYLIVMPNVRQHKTEYRDIKFYPGDKVQIVAGGCVNPGVTISFPPIPPSRRYVDPIDKDGKALNALYGLINIPGAMNGLQPIKNYNNKTVQIPAIGVNPSSLYLSLGYEDSNYDDNTYIPMDPGEKGQCSVAPLPAFVALTITPAKNNSLATGAVDMSKDSIGSADTAAGSGPTNTGTSQPSGAHTMEPAPSHTNTGKPVTSGSTAPATSGTTDTPPQKGTHASTGTTSYGKPTTGTPSSVNTVTCAPKITVNTQIDDAWVKSKFGASAQSANLNPVDVFVSSSSKSQDGYVSCHYKSAKGEIYNLVYKFACKNAVSTGSNSYSCSK